MTRRDRDLKRIMQNIADDTRAHLLAIERTGSGHRCATFLSSTGTVVNVIAPWSP